MDNSISKHSSGFTLIELMIVIAIIGILATISIPQYQRYTQKAKFSNIITTTATYKTAVNLCAQEDNGLATCSPGTHHGIPPNLGPQGVLQSLQTVQGTISVVGNAEVENHTYTLIPTWHLGNTVLWNSTGSCKAANYCR